MIEINNLSLNIDGKQILKDISFNVLDNEILTVFGPSGVGKTSLLKSIIGFNKIDSGEILINGKDVSKLPINERNIGFVFQNSTLISEMTVKENILLINNNDKKIKKLFIKLNIINLLNKYPSVLSSGELQKVLIARALINEPDLLLLDESFSNVDIVAKQYIQRDIKKILHDLNIPTIIVSHNKDDAFFMSDRALILNNGEIEQINNLDAMYEYPESIFVAKLLGECNIIKKDDEDILIRPEWIVPSKGGKFKVVSHIFYGMYNRLIITDGNINNTLIIYDFLKKIKLGDYVDIKLRKAQVIKKIK